MNEETLVSYFTESGAEATGLMPVPMSPPEGRRVASVAEPSPLTMTALQQLVAADDRGGDLDHLERIWLKRRRVRRSERLLLNAALLVTAVLISGAFAFVKLEDSVASSRHEADRQWLLARNERQAAIEAECREALTIASVALTQPTWTDLLSHVKDGRRLLSEIRDHFSRWSYAPFHEPELGVVKRVEDGSGVVRVSVRVDGSKPWASTIVMQKVNGEFKLDWPSFQRRFDRTVHHRVARGSGGGASLLIGGDAFFGTLPSLAVDEDLPSMNWGESAFLGMSAESPE